VHTVLEALLPKADESKADCAGHAADARTQDQQPSRGIRLNENPRFCGGHPPLVLGRISSMIRNTHCTLIILTGVELPRLDTSPWDSLELLSSPINTPTAAGPTPD
jgi:hypothetical protein